MTMRFVMTALLLGCAASLAAAEDAQSLIAKNLEARGGAAAFDALRNVQLEGRIIFPGDFELSYKETRARVGSASAGRFDLTLQGLGLVQAYDGQGGWKVNPFQGRKDPERMSADEARALADTSLVEGALLHSRSDGSKVQYLGREDFDGTLAYKLKVTQTDGDEFVYWLDPDTFLEIKVDETRRVRGAQQTTENELGDYEKIAGVYFPMSVESWGQGSPNQRARLILASGAANVPVAPELFAEPKAGPPARPGGAAPDASNKSRAKPGASDKPDESKEAPADPSKPSQGE
jgi:hypothetical protein